MSLGRTAALPSATQCPKTKHRHTPAPGLHSVRFLPSGSRLSSPHPLFCQTLWALLPPGDWRHTNTPFSQNKASTPGTARALLPSSILPSPDPPGASLEGEKSPGKNPAPMRSILGLHSRALLGFISQETLVSNLTPPRALAARSQPPAARLQPHSQTAPARFVRSKVSRELRRCTVVLVPDCILPTVLGWEQQTQLYFPPRHYRVRLREEEGEQPPCKVPPSPSRLGKQPVI